VALIGSFNVAKGACQEPAAGDEPRRKSIYGGIAGGRQRKWFWAAAIVRLLWERIAMKPGGISLDKPLDGAIFRETKTRDRALPMKSMPGYPEWLRGLVEMERINE
jgi:hypothetical protein